MSSDGLKEVTGLGYNVIAAVYQTDAFKADIRFDANGRLLVIHNGNVICSFHAEKNDTSRGQVGATFHMTPYEDGSEENESESVETSKPEAGAGIPIDLGSKPEDPPNDSKGGIFNKSRR